MKARWWFSLDLQAVGFNMDAYPLHFADGYVFFLKNRLKT